MKKLFICFSLIGALTLPAFASVLVLTLVFLQIISGEE